MRKSAVAAIFCLLLLSAGLQAALVPVTSTDYIGSRTTPSTSGVVASDGWDEANGGFKIAWDISFNATTNLWTYVYTLSDKNGGIPATPGISHFIIEVSDTFTSANVFAGSTGGYELNGYGGSGWNASNACTATSPSGNPCLPGSGFVKGLKWDQTTATLVTDRAPVWGDFYAKDGTPKSGVVATAWNLGFGTDPSGSVFTNWIPTPDTTSFPPNVIPEPATVMLLGTVALVLSQVIRKRMAAQ
jgi:hypothetical protein